MGGKTHQRVAGNVKPSSSGRIRELLINKHGAGNPLATFSTLSSIQNKQQTTKVEQRPENVQPKLQDLQSQVDETPSISIGDDPGKQSDLKADRPVLVLKRVGNREFFTRVRITEGSKKSSDNVQTVSFVSKDMVTRHSLDPNSTETSVEYPINDNEKDELNSNVSELVSESDISDDHSNSNRISSESEDDLGNDTAELDELNFMTILDRLSVLHCSMTSRTELEPIDKINYETLVKASELILLLEILVKKFYTELSIEEWDLIGETIEFWVSSISMTQQLLNLPQEANILCTKIFKFIYHLKQLVKKCDEIQSTDEFPMIRLLLDDFKNFCSSDVYKELVISYFKIAITDNYTSQDMVLIRWLTAIILDTNPIYVIANHNLPHIPDTKLDLEIKLPKNCSFCIIESDKSHSFNSICDLLRKNHRPFSILAHSMLCRLIDTICENPLINFDENDVELHGSVEDTFLLPPAALFDILSSRDLMMSALLSDYKVGDVFVSIEPKSDSYNCTLSYLLIWDIIIQFIVNIDKEAGHTMIHSLKRLGLIQRLLDNIFMLLPPVSESKLLNLNSVQNVESLTNNQKWTLTDFLKANLNIGLDRPRNEIELVALHVFFSVAWHMPVTVRKWYNNNSNKRLCNMVNEYTVKYISSVICSLEMETVQSKCQERANEDKLKNLIIKARPNAREVYAIYIRDEFKMELTIKLPINYPLGPVQIDGGKRIGVTDVKWRSWLLQLTRFLAHQNGPLLDGIDLWRKNIDKRFEGVEKCMICFSILHSNYQLPKKKCQTCLKMFHNLCIYKWFESSGNSTCPLCRNIW